MQPVVKSQSGTKQEHMGSKWGSVSPCNTAKGSADADVDADADDEVSEVSGAIWVVDTADNVVDNLEGFSPESSEVFSRETLLNGVVCRESVFGSHTVIVSFEILVTRLVWTKVM